MENEKLCLIIGKLPFWFYLENNDWGEKKSNSSTLAQPIPKKFRAESWHKHCQLRDHSKVNAQCWSIQVTNIFLIILLDVVQFITSENHTYKR